METVELLGRDCKSKQVKIPEGYKIKKTGTCIRGDRYWHWPSGMFFQVKDSHSFLWCRAENLQCVITPVKEDQENNS